MPLHVRSIAVCITAVFFFSIAIVGWISGLSPFTCCKKATIGAVIAYIAATYATKAINAILINAMITNHIKKQKEKAGGSTNS